MKDIIELFPDNWKVKKFRQIFGFRKGLSITKEDLLEEGCPVISYGQVHSKENTGIGINQTLIRFVSEKYLYTDKISIVEPGDFIFADTSEDIDGVGNCVFVDFKSTLFAGYHTIIVHPTISECYPLYFAFLFLTDFWRANLRAKVMGVKVFSITQKLLRETFVVLPPVYEQRAIANFLYRECAQIDSIVADLEKQIAILQQYKKSLITETIIKGLDKSVPMKDSGIEGVGKIPSHWKVNRLKYVAVVKTGPFGTQLSASEYSDEGIPVINVKNIGYGTIIEDDLDYVPDEVCQRLAQHQLQLGDIVFGRKGAVDKHAIITESQIGWVQGSDCIRVRIDGDIDSRYLNYLFNTVYFAEYVLLYAVGTTMASINSDILTNSKILVPPITEQRCIADFLDSNCKTLFEIIENKQSQLATLQQHKKSLIYEYVTGKKRVKEVR